MDREAGNRRLGGSQLGPLLLVYAAGFLALHEIAANWAHGATYSLWFPAAGLRFAILWTYGARLALPLALVELAVQSAVGRVALDSTVGFLSAAGIIGPPLAYGLAIWLVRRKDGALFSANPMPVGFAAVVAPFFGSLAGLPWHLLGGSSGIESLPEAMASVVVATSGDLLGVLLVAPPLLWLLGGRPWRDRAPRLGWMEMIELVVVLALGWGAVAAIYAMGQGLRLQPVLLATVWIGFRFGRVPAWLAAACSAAVVLPITPGVAAPADRLGIHMLLACIAAGGYLAGSYADAETRLRQELKRRDKMLLQAERLKTLRAMSVAVIHEISQPLSTIALEIRHLRRAAEDGAVTHEDLLESTALIERKASYLSEMVRRLRSFGGRASGEASRIPAELLLREVAEITAAEARGLNVTLHQRADPGIVVTGQDIELQQALANLVRNAVQASPDGEVRIAVARSGARVRFDVSNLPTIPRSGGSGMGIGIMVARTIAEFHGGEVELGTDGSGLMTASLILPDTVGGDGQTRWAS